MQPSASSPIAPMLAKAVPEVPAPDSVAGGLSYEPKWDGFRAIVYADGEGAVESVEIGSRGSKMLTRYFPELVEAFRSILPGPCVLDGEIVVPTGEPGKQRLDWEALSQRIHPAASRVKLLSEKTPATFVAFDLLAIGDESFVDRPFAERRAALEEFAGDLPAPIALTRTTTDVDVARHWLVEFEGAGLDGVVAKPFSGVYAPNKRTMLKIKHHRTADVVALGYRIHKSGQGVGSLLVGLYGDDGMLRNVGGVSAFSDAKRLALIDELAPLVERDESGEAVTGETDRSRFSSGKDVSFVRLRPERVLEVRYDQMEGMRFRHTAQFERWRPDREAASCTFDQLDRPIAYDLADVLT
ncbi:MULTISPECIES: ATP-dependent DNA ligase [unclassified Leifsonia]|uniref:ATP-dependent DNA ligase n=1 Tax=unclassified Leifsonia TaxID=2663824 RepID=UPI0008A73658|nr:MULTISPECIES: ATP-dependent DNA ligase [unclassified Leifsonia]SEH72566.1 ATP-dependent DNA ligase [Leifsonia sp. CL154]SFL33869.1 ATP-dependent DNA ligase [Leifsonia sp. CL147]